MLNRFNSIVISMTATMLLVLTFVVLHNSEAVMTVQEESSGYMESKMPELRYYDKYDDLRSDGKTTVVYPIFTQSAYDWGGIHDYYSGYCDTCTNDVVLHHTYEKTLSASGNGFRVLEFLGYQVIDDMDIDKNPAILEQFDKVILLHNEFVTKSEFEAIMKHPKVIYLYPNALTSQIHVDYETNTIDLIRGPSYPTLDVTSGFDWKHNNSQYEKDWNCNSWEFYTISNGYMLNCYPETFLPNDGYEMLKKLSIL